MSFFKKLFKSEPPLLAEGEQPSGPPARGVHMKTNMGDITIQLYSEQAPKTCLNFSTLSDAHKYDNTIFHRVIKGFMIQGGDYTRGDGTGGRSAWGKKFEDEISPALSHDGAGILSMANAGPRTNGSQFFITLADCTHLDGKHTIFGKVTEGLDVVRRIGTTRTGELDRPVEEVRILECRSFK